MPASTDRVQVYLEVGSKRTFAGALEWPGWCRSGRDEVSAIDALVSYGPRYAAALRGSRLGFRAPGEDADVHVAERLRGGATTDFGAPEAVPSVDASPVNEADLRRLQALLRACWRALDRAVEVAAGKELRKGPRGGGRSVEGIVEHVLEADGAYLSRIGVKLGRQQRDDAEALLRHTRNAVLEGLASAAREGVPPAPRGGARWSPRYFARRVAWHALDHAWEIDDRIGG